MNKLKQMMDSDPLVLDAGVKLTLTFLIELGGLVNWLYFK